MKKVFLSEKNITNQTKKLITLLNLEPEQLNRNTVINCKKIITNSMAVTFDKYGERKPENITPVEYLDKMNKKSLSDCLKVFESKKEIKSRDNSQSLQLKEASIKKKTDNNQFGLSPNKNQYMRPDELMGKMKTPQHPDQTSSPSKEYQSYSDAGGYASFSSIDTASGPFITATGEYGLPIEMQGNQMGNQMQSTNDGKKNFADDLQRKMDALRYEGGYGGGAQGGMQGNMGQQQGYQNQGQQNMGNQVDFLQKMLPGVDMSAFMNQTGMSQQQGFQGQQQQGYQGQQNQGQQNNQANPMMQFAQLSQMMNQMQQSGQVNPQIMQQIMSQMQMLMMQMQGGNAQGGNAQGGNMQGGNMQGGNMQGGNMQHQNNKQNNMPNQMQNNQQQGQPGLDFDYSFNTGGDNLGNDFNVAYGGTSAYSGIDSFDGVYQHNSITEPVKNLSENSGDLSNALEKMKADRDNVNKSLGNMQKPQTFDPMQSPSQFGNNQKQQFQDDFFF